MRRFLILMFIILSTSCARSPSDSESDYYLELDHIRENKKGELIQYMEMIDNTISSIKDDGPLIDSFELIDMTYNSYKNNAEIPKNDISLNEIEAIIQESYLDRFMIFDNILFINKDGDVFYSLKKKSPLLENIFQSEYQNSELSKNLMSNPLTPAVDFGLFSKDDPSAFFIYPVIKNSEHLGWCAFQFSSNRLETLFSKETGLGKTGEIFMVNENSYMLTDSSFFPEASVLKLHLSDENISSKFSEGMGHKKIIDYRGYEAITSFEVLSLYNLNWLLIAKIDLDEIITNDFLKNKDEYYSIIKKKSLNIQKTFFEGISFNEYSNEVSLDQFKRISGNENIYTHGVSTCTAVIITLPEKFSYLAHISAYDSLYEGNSTDLISNMFDRIKKYEIPDYLLRELKIYVITPQIRFTQNIIEKLVNEGIFLSQIFFVKNKNASYANVYHDLSSGDTYVEWKMDTGEMRIEDLNAISNIGEIIGEYES